MSDNSNVATPQYAEEYITERLTNSELHMKEACKELGWSFPRIRSKSITICKKLGGDFTKRKRGVYYLNTQTTDNLNDPEPNAASVGSTAEISESTTPPPGAPVGDVE